MLGGMGLPPACSNLAMPDFAEPLARLIDEFKRLPGIGQKSAQRIAFHVLRAPREDAERLAQALLDVKDKLGICAVCNNISDGELCQYCRDPHRDHSLICVVEEPHNILRDRDHAAVSRRLSRAAWRASRRCAASGPEQLKIKGLVDRIEQGRGRGDDRGHQSDGGRRGDGGLSVAAAEAAGREGDAHRHGHSGGQRSGVRRRSDDVEITREPPGDVAWFNPRGSETGHKWPAITAARRRKANRRAHNQILLSVEHVGLRSVADVGAQPACQRIFPWLDRMQSDAASRPR